MDYPIFAMPKIKPAGFFLRLWMRIAGRRIVSEFGQVWYERGNVMYVTAPGRWP